MKTAEDIVRALAEEAPTSYSDDGEYHECAICKKAYVTGPETHEPTCLHRLAVEWTEENRAS